jgi:hypothetical protein
MFVPYLGLIGGTLLLARVPQERFERFWWLAPIAAVLFLLLLAITVAALTSSSRMARVRGRIHSDEAISELERLGDIGDIASVARLRSALTHHDPHTAFVAGQALARFQSREACEGLVNAVREGMLPMPLAATLLETSAFADETLVAVILGDPDPRVRALLARLLGYRDKPDRLWLGWLAHDQDAEVRRSAREALAAVC